MFGVAYAIPLPRGAKIPNSYKQLHKESIDNIESVNGWDLEKGFDIPSGSEDWRETQWSGWLAKKLDGIPEARTYTGQRVDILTSEYAIEVGWAKESVISQDIEQTKSYAHMTYRKPAIIWLSDDSEKSKKAIKIMQVRCQYQNIKLYIQRVK